MLIDNPLVEIKEWLKHVIGQDGLFYTTANIYIVTYITK